MEYMNGLTLKHMITGHALDNDTLLPWALKSRMCWMPPMPKELFSVGVEHPRRRLA